MSARRDPVPPEINRTALPSGSTRAPPAGATGATLAVGQGWQRGGERTQGVGALAWGTLGLGHLALGDGARAFCSVQGGCSTKGGKDPRGEKIPSG